MYSTVNRITSCKYGSVEIIFPHLCMKLYVLKTTQPLLLKQTPFLFKQSPKRLSHARETSGAIRHGLG